MYIGSTTSRVERLARICAIIEALELQVVNVGAGNSDIDEYMLNDGQIIIKTKYRSIDSIYAAIAGFEKLKEKLYNQLNGRCTVLRPWRGQE